MGEITYLLPNPGAIRPLKTLNYRGCCHPIEITLLAKDGLEYCELWSTVSFPPLTSPYVEKGIGGIELRRAHISVSFEKGLTWISSASHEIFLLA